MPRQKRTFMPNGWYHVYNRGAAYRHIFVSDEFKYHFINLLELTVEKYNVKIASFCIMGNHYHLLINTPEANLDKAMQFLNHSYSLWFNKKRKKDGPIYRRRYNAIYVKDESYLIALTRYIHLNPVEAKLVNHPSDYYWSSCNDFLNKKKEFYWLDNNLIKDLDKAYYNELLNKGNNKQIKKIFSKTYPPSVI